MRSVLLPLLAVAVVLWILYGLLTMEQSSTGGCSSDITIGEDFR